ncbi:O-succinylbenzoic acid--CoA ligase [Patiriisocius marinistellae]|uniref:O-succinylbenzoic acid--CoA ligase n=1 Tax=Patiriisocius marinistellae TaxID=2494560 RepID=A0A5J4FYV3_9FLAO|nr:AMP-binding protein [Patiriisocius marinistellae]GEQ86578.1 O-succinylbenzoic acid--CoA ligase [Patiriisocius marinistellae]
MLTSQLHPAFKFNGLQFDHPDDLLAFAHRLKEDGVKFEQHVAKFIIKWFNEENYIKVKTSGSTGKSKKIKLQKLHMINSAKATGVFFKMGEGNTAILCLSAKYIAGKMMLVRALTMGWDLHVVAPEKDAITQYDNKYDFAAMVPYQVYHSMKALNKVKKLIIGGGEISSELEELLQQKNVEAFATYGMTETITHVAVRRINGAGRTIEYAALPNVKFSIDERGCLIIEAAGISQNIIVTNDLVTLLTPTSFIWLGRFDNVINTGGVKVFPEQIEKKISSEINLPFIISSKKDEALGERVILVLETEDSTKISNYSEVFQKLSQYERPKKIYTLSKFPLTENGKIKRNEIKGLLARYKFIKPNEQ